MLPREVSDPSLEVTLPLCMPLHPGIPSPLHYFTSTLAALSQDMPVLDFAAVDDEVPMDFGVFFQPPFTLGQWAACQLQDYDDVTGHRPGFGFASSVTNGVEERVWRCILLQALHTLAFLKDQHVAHCSVNVDSLFVDEHHMVTLGDFSMARRTMLPPAPGDASVTTHSPHHPHLHSQWYRIIVSDKQDAVYRPVRAMDPLLVHTAAYGPPLTHDPYAMLTRETLYESSDLYALGVCMHELLQPGGVQPVTPGQFKMPVLSPTLSPKLAWLLSWLVAPSPTLRPSPLFAWRVLCCLCFGPVPAAPGMPPAVAAAVGAVASPAHCGVWLLQQLANVLMAPSPQANDPMSQQRLLYLVDASADSIWADVQAVHQQLSLEVALAAERTSPPRM